MFAYCLNNPVGLTDSHGLAAVSALSPEADPRSSPTDDVTTGGGIGAGLAGIAMVAAMVSSHEKVKADVIELKEGPSKRIYTVYFLYDADGSPNKIVYVGRVKTDGFKAHMAYHKMQGRLEKWHVDGLTWAECRGLEQVGMVFFHTINRNNSIYNQIRGISPQNTSRTIYFDAAKAFWTLNGSSYDYLMPASYWVNWTENEFLNGGI